MKQFAIFRFSILRFAILLTLLFAGMTIFAQSIDMSYYTEEYNNATATFADRLEILETVRNAGFSGISEFYHEALKVLITRIPDIGNIREKETVEASARLLCQELAAEKYTAAAPELWQLVQSFPVIRDINDGFVMQDALIALGQVDAKEFVPHIVQTLDDINTLATSDVETRRRVQRAAVGAINALEALHELPGFRPVFFASIGWFDPAIKDIASAALPNIVEDPGESIIEIIRNQSNNPEIKYEAWREMLLTNAPNSSKAKVAAVALDIGWIYSTATPAFQRSLREMRKSAIDIVRLYGVEDDSVYVNLERSYSNNFINTTPDYDEIRKTLDTLSVTATNEAVELLLKFLRELHARRRSGPWGNKERQLLQWVIPSLGATSTQSAEVTQLLTTIQRSDAYTGAEQGWARDALRALGQ